ncbi:MAG: HAMP domain-containing histidine kinase [Roseburia sp.]|nr:HAMP domain-containing histidine kinase [Roseburia sp.]
MVQNFKYYQQQMLEEFFTLWILLLVLLGVVVLAFYFAGQWQQRKEEKRILDDVDVICTQLEQFRRGNFEVASYFSVGDGKKQEKRQERAGTTRNSLPAKIRNPFGSKLSAKIRNPFESKLSAKSRNKSESRLSAKIRNKSESRLLVRIRNKSDSDFRENEHWVRVRELLRELAYYFSDIKERLVEEENSTKALITDISHQLKTPLASLRMSHELTEAENLTESERREFAEKETQEIEKLEMLLEELVNLSRLENHMIQIKPEPLGIKQTITEAVNQIFMKAHVKNIEIQVKLENDVMIRHDRKWTVEALANVLDNAVKYSEPQTCIGIRVSPLPSNLLIEIEDEGIGISEEDLHRIFKRFYRGKLASGYAREGAGVGLYLARSILEQQGGSIIAKRKMERGTIFKITLPLA